MSLSLSLKDKYIFVFCVIDLIGQLRRDVIGRLSVKPGSYWL